MVPRQRNLAGGERRRWRLHRIIAINRPRPATSSLPEIEDAVHYAKSSAGWSTYISGLQLNLDQFKAEVLAACDYVRAQQKKHA
jgi:hypothetical protein